MSHHREPIDAPDAPAAVGPYVHAVRAGGLVFCSGQIGFDPQTMEIVGETSGEQAGACLRNLGIIAEAAGASLADAVRITVYLTDMGEWGDVNDVYAGFFGDAPPARVAVGVAALPKGAKVEMDAVIAMPD